jgi:hypothetical protein
VVFGGIWKEFAIRGKFVGFRNEIPVF